MGCYWFVLPYLLEHHVYMHANCRRVGGFLIGHHLFHRGTDQCKFTSHTPSALGRILMDTAENIIPTVLKT